ncbi:hypothetical protein A6J66_010005 [Yersinia enterocolitica]|nr:hypothetical protein A6J66_010005 [Yersinia enterocolitica]
MLAGFTHPNHLTELSSSGLTRWLPACNVKCFGYRYPLPYQPLHQNNSAVNWRINCMYFSHLV